MNRRGQFFSPDLLIAMGVFVFALALFFATSNAVFSQIQLFEDRKKADEVAHSMMNSLVLSGGQPYDWENHPLSDANSIGIAVSDNVIDQVKLIALLEALDVDANYLDVKKRLGVGPFDVYFKVTDSGGNTVFINSYELSEGRVAVDPKVILSYKRTVILNGSAVVFDALISLEA